jgi:glyoxylase-like metal-dependent hydrolase (beta-lactamase superfamily II)
MTALIKTVFDTPPPPGEVVQVGPGILWTRMPLNEVPDHVNIFVLEERDGWTLVDTGKNTPDCTAALDRLLVGPLRGKPITRVLVTHFHPDHIGLLGRLVRDGATAWATRDTWVYARLTQMEKLATPSAEHLGFASRCGVKGIAFEAYRRKPPSDYPASVLPIPHGFVRVIERDEIAVGSRRWRVHIGQGHAPGHATYWSDDGFAIVGDHVLPGMSADLSVYVSEPDSDPIREWNESCRKFAAIATPDTVCLAGHNLPFTGIAVRCEQLIATHEGVLQRLLAALQRPRTAVECLEVIHGRRLSPPEMSERLGEAMGYLNHLHQTGRVERTLDRTGAYSWRVLAALQPEPKAMAKRELLRPSSMASPLT